MVKIVDANLEHIPNIQHLSSIVWPVTFEEILSHDQIVYMMEMMYSTQSLTQQMNEGHCYIIAEDEEGEQGYLSYQTNIAEGYTKIHKIYVLPTAQGKGIGSKLIEYAKRKAIQADNKSLKLNVNRFNKAIDFYKTIGFTIAGTEDIDIGNNFLMEDFILEMKI